MPSRVLLSLAIVIAAVAAERFGHSAQFMFMPLTMQQFGLTAAEVGKMIATASFAQVAGMLVAGGGAFVVTPRMLGGAGAILAMLGLCIFAFSSAENTAWIAVTIEGFGSGLVYVSALAYAARVLTYEGETDAAPASRRRFLALGCFVATAGVATSIAAASASLVGFLYEMLNSRAATLVAAAAMLASAACFGISLLVDRDQVAPSNAPPANIAYRTGPGVEAPPTAEVKPAPIVVALALAVPLTVMSVVGTASFEFTMRENFASQSAAHGVQVLMGVLSGVGVAAFLGVLASKRSPASLFRFVGAGFILCAAGALLFLPRVAPVGAMAVLGIAGPFAGLGVVFAALAVRGRAATLLIASLLTVQMFGTMLGWAALEHATASTAIAAVLLFAAGGAVFVFDKRLQAVFVE